MVPYSYKLPICTCLRRLAAERIEVELAHVHALLLSQHGTEYSTRIIFKPRLLQTTYLHIARRLAAERIEGELTHVDGETFLGQTQLNKTIRKAIAEETEIYTKDSARFIHGAGVKA